MLRYVILTSWFFCFFLTKTPNITEYSEIHIIFISLNIKAELPEQQPAIQKLGLIYQAGYEQIYS